MVVLALLLAPRAEGSGWSAPRTIADAVATGYQDSPTVVAGPRGRLAAAWTQADGIGIAVSRRGRRFGPPAIVPRSKDEYFPALGIDSSGNTTIAWVYQFGCSYDGISEDVCEGVHAAARLKSGAFTKRRTLTSERYDTFFPRVSVAPGGRAAVWWGGLEDYGAGARIASRPGQFGRTQLKNRDIHSWTFDRRGRTAQVVIQNKHSLVAFTRGPGGRLRNRQVLVRVGDPEFYVFDVGTDSQGLRSAGWGHVTEGRAGRPDVGSLVVGLRTLHGRLGPQTLARDPGQSGVNAAIDTGPTGFTVAAWGIRAGTPIFDYYGYGNAYEQQLRAAISLPSRRFSRSQLLQPRYRERPVYGFDAGAGPRSAIFAWRGTRADGSQGVYAAHAGANGHFARPHLLSGDSSAPMSDPAVVVDRNDNAMVVWIDGLSVRAARFVSGGP